MKAVKKAAKKTVKKTAGKAVKKATDDFVSIFPGTSSIPSSEALKTYLDEALDSLDAVVDSYCLGGDFPNGSNQIIKRIDIKVKKIKTLYEKSGGKR